MLKRILDPLHLQNHLTQCKALSALEPPERVTQGRRYLPAHSELLAIQESWLLFLLRPDVLHTRSRLRIRNRLSVRRQVNRRSKARRFQTNHFSDRTLSVSDRGAFMDDVDACLLVFGNYRSSEARSGRFSDFDAFLDSNRELSFPSV